MPGRENKLRHEAGRKFRHLRNENQYDLADVERETLSRYGEEFVVHVSQLSRLEKGDHARVSIDDAMTLAAFYGISPIEVCRWYGVPVAPEFLEAAEDRPQVMVQLEDAFRELTPEVARHLLERVRWDVMDAKQIQNEFVGPRSNRKRPTEPPAAREPVHQ